MGSSNILALKIPRYMALVQIFKWISRTISPNVSSTSLLVLLIIRTEDFVVLMFAVLYLFFIFP